MTGLDTNVIVRFLVRDDERQAQSVYRRFKQAESEGEALFVSLCVVLETIWVLESAYDQSRFEVLDALEDMRRMPILQFERDDVLQRLLLEGRTCKADLSDLLIAHSGEANGCGVGITFDRKAARLPFYKLLT